jgi:hypothetical protein
MSPLARTIGSFFGKEPQVSVSNSQERLLVEPSVAVIERHDGINATFKQDGNFALKRNSKKAVLLGKFSSSTKVSNSEKCPSAPPEELPYKTVRNPQPARAVLPYKSYPYFRGHVNLIIFIAS